MKYAIVLLLAACACAEKNVFENLPSINLEDVKTAVKDNCDQNGGKGTFDKLMSSVEDMKNFVETNFDTDQIEKEIEESSKAGELDEVFKKYCDLQSKSLDKVHKIIDSITNCVAEDERSVVKLIANITESLMNFACDKDGERIALFIAEDGFKCIADKSEQLQKCGNEVVGDKVPTTFDKIPKLDITKAECDDYKKLQSCVVKTLGTCEKDMPSEIIDALFNYMYNLSPCTNLA